MIYAQVNTATNHIEQFVGFNGPANLAVHAAANPQAFFVASPEWGSPRTHRYDPVTGTVAPKPALGATLDKDSAIADGLDKITVSGLPTGTRFGLSGPAYGSDVVMDGALELTFDFPGTYKLRLDVEGYLTQEVTIHAL